MPPPPHPLARPLAHGTPRRGRVHRNVARLLVALAAAYLAVLATIYTNQRALLFHPDPTRISPAARGLNGISEVVIPTPDGERLIAWWSPPTPTRPVFLYFHGNANTIAARSGRIAHFQHHGLGVLMLSYRGYGGSTGRPSETALVADAGEAYQWLKSNGIAANRIVLFGESLGTGIAVQLAASRPVAGVILDSPYTSIADVAALRYWYLPVRELMWDQFNSMAYIGRTRAPLLVFHGDRDPVVPYAFGRKLFAAANEPKRFLTLPGAGHVAPLDQGPWRAIAAYLATLPNTAHAPRPPAQ